jgi:polyhydroxyalkanoate synthesis regulator phasin
MSSGKSTLNNGNPILAGRQEVNKIRKEISRLQEENWISLYQMQCDIAHNGEKIEQRISCQQFLLDKILPKATPIPASRYVKIEIIPMNSMEDIRTNEKTIMEYVSKGEISLEEGKDLFSMTEQSRKTYEATEIAKMLIDMDQRMKEKGI